MGQPATNKEPTPNEIVSAVINMMSVLQILNAISRRGTEVPFAETINEALAKFNTPEMRGSLVNRLYYPNRYTTPSRPR